MKAKLIKEEIYVPSEKDRKIQKIIEIVHKNMKEYGAIPGDWRHFFEDLGNELESVL